MARLSRYTVRSPLESRLQLRRKRPNMLGKRLENDPDFKANGAHLEQTNEQMQTHNSIGELQREGF